MSDDQITDTGGQSADVSKISSHDDAWLRLKNSHDPKMFSEAWLEIQSRLEGDKGNDILLGGSGDDYLKGGSDADILEGGPGADTLKKDNQDIRVEQGTGATPLGLITHFAAFDARFSQDGFFFVGPTGGDPAADDRPARSWIADYLASLSVV